MCVFAIESFDGESLMTSRQGVPYSGDAEDSAKYDDSEFQRLDQLYSTLTDQERQFVVTQWDFQHGLENWQERPRKKEQLPRIRARQSIVLDNPEKSAGFSRSRYSENAETEQRGTSLDGEAEGVGWAAVKLGSTRIPSA